MVPPMKTSLLALFAVACFACSSSTDDDEPGPSGDTETRCLDGSGTSEAPCAVEPSEEICELGDSNECLVVEREEVWADDGETGPCFFFYGRNVCEDTLYSVVCIEHESDEAPAWQCWWSTTLPGAVLDVSQCDATGRYRHVSTLTDSKLDVYADKCGY